MSALAYFAFGKRSSGAVLYSSSTRALPTTEQMHMQVVDNLAAATPDIDYQPVTLDGDVPLYCQPFSCGKELSHQRDMLVFQVIDRGDVRLGNEEEMMKAESSPPNGAIRFVLAGLGLKALGRKEEARAAFEQALRIEPQNELVKEQLRELSD